MDIRTHILKECLWKFENGLELIDSYAFKWMPSEGLEKWQIVATTQDYLNEWQWLIDNGTIVVDVIFDGLRNDDRWNGNFKVWRIMEVRVD